MRIAYLNNNLYIDLNYSCLFGIIILKIFKDNKIIKNNYAIKHDK